MSTDKWIALIIAGVGTVLFYLVKDKFSRYDTRIKDQETKLNELQARFSNKSETIVDVDTNVRHLEKLTDKLEILINKFENDLKSTDGKLNDLTNRVVALEGKIENKPERKTGG